jgi:hypothetical protein
MFNAMMDGIKEESVGNLFNLQFEVQENPIVEEVPGGTPPVMLGTGTAPAGTAPTGTAPAGAAPAGGAHARRPQAGEPPAGEPEPSAPPAAFAGPAVERPGSAQGSGRRGRPGQGGSAQGSGRREGTRQGSSGQGGGSGQSGSQAGSGQGRTRQGGKHAADGRGHATPAGRGQTATQSGGGAHAAGAAPADRAGVPASLQPNRPRQLQYSAPSEGGGVEHRGDTSTNPYANVGRNDLCPCGSGRKYKRCHGDPRNA